MIKNTEKVSEVLLHESNLNIILGEIASGKTEVCKFIERAAVRKNLKCLNIENDLSFVELNIWTKIDEITKEFDVIFLNELHFKNDSEPEKLKEFVRDMVYSSKKNNCTIFITTITKTTVTNVPDWIEKNPSTLNLMHSYMSDNILVVRKIKEAQTPFIIRVFKYFFKFNMPNSEIKFIKSRIIPPYRNNIFYLYFDKQTKRYLDVNRKNPVLKLYYDF